MMLSPEERAKFTAEAPRRVQATHDRDALVAEFRANNHAIEAVESRWRRRSARAAQPHPQLVANDMIATVDDPELGHTTQIGVPIHLRGTPGAIQGPQPHAG